MRRAKISHTVQLYGTIHALDEIHIAVQAFKDSNGVIVDTVIFQTTDNAFTGNVVVVYHYKRKLTLVQILKHVKRPYHRKTLADV